MNAHVAIFTLLAASIVGCSPAPAPKPVAEFNPTSAPTVEFSVPDMMCPDGCGVAVKGILAKQAGVKDVFVDFDTKTATVAIEEGTFDADAAIAALVDKQFDNSALKNAAASVEPASATTAPTAN